MKSYQVGKHGQQFLQDKEAAVAATRKPRWERERSMKTQSYALALTWHQSCKILFPAFNETKSTMHR